MTPSISLIRKGLFLFLLAAVGAVATMKPIEPFIKMNRSLMDRYMDRIPSQNSTDRVILVLAQEPSFLELGGWPWPRSIHGRLLERLEKARTVVLDMIFPEESIAWQDRFLADQVSRHGNCVVAYHLAEKDGTITKVLPYRDLLHSASAIGVANVVPDVDGLYRFIIPLWTVGSGSQPSLSLAAVLSHRKESIRLSSSGKGHALILGDRVFPLNENGGVWVDHRSLGRIPVYEYSDVLTGRISEDVFDDAMVIVGVNVAGLGIQDTVTLYDRGEVRPIPGASFVAMSVATLLETGGIKSLAQGYEALLSSTVVLLSGTIGLIAPPVWSWAAVLLATVATATIPFILLSTWGIWISPGAAIVLGVLSYLIAMVYRLLGLSRSVKIGSVYSNLLASITFGTWKENAAGMSDETVLDRVWPEIEKLTSIRLLRKHVSSQAISKAMTDGKIISQDDGTSLVKLHGTPERYHMFIRPPSGWEGAVELGWSREISKEDLGSAVAVVLTACWFSVALHREQQRREAIQGAIKAIVAAVDAKDQDTRGHSERVASISRELAIALGLPSDFIDELYLGATLHDVGKIGIPDAILQKPEKLTDREYAKIKEHPSIGMEIMSAVDLSDVAKEALMEHHEKLDGSGYPLGLKGDRISLAGRIVAVADAFDALSSKRIYKDGWPLEKVLDLFDRDSGILYDPKVVKALHRIGPEWYARSHDIKDDEGSS